jgi:hypothetical protein
MRKDTKNVKRKSDGKIARKRRIYSRNRKELSVGV